MKNANILIVEDESIVAKDIQQTLEKLGYNVIATLAEGEKALAIVKEHNPDLIFMDIMMRDCPGPKAAILIKTCEELQHIPIIFVTASPDFEKLLDPYKEDLKGFAHLTKPVTVPQILACVEKTLKLTSKAG